MTDAQPTRYRLDFDGRTFEVATESWLNTTVRLFVDGEQVDEKKTWDQSATLEGGGLGVTVRRGWLGQIRESFAVPVGADPDDAERQLAFQPPPGSLAAKIETFAREHPELYAARHVVGAILQLLVGVIGVWALVREVLARFIPAISWPELPAIPLPALPDIPWPDLPDLPLPEIDLPDIAIPGWVGAILASAKWWVPILIALFVAIAEVERRRKRSRAATTTPESQKPQAS